jgi:hypothetical protein
LRAKPFSSLPPHFIIRISLFEFPLMPLYFSYGSNMDVSQMLLRCPCARLLGPAQLPNHRLDFTLFSQTRQCGCPDIIPQPSSSVYGALYSLSDPDLLALDTYEGVPRQKYHRITVTVLDPTHTPVKTFTYAVLHKSPTTQKPSRAFLAQLLASATHLAFPADYLAFLQSTPTCD